jgi:2-methylisocitrate lyase-like PEP mutase family enzyme
MDLFRTPIDGPARLRELLGSGDPIAAPGCFDPFSARIAEAAGFDVVYMTGNGASAVRTGRADVGLMTAEEMSDQAGRIVDAVSVPLIADADTGYGGPLNVIRTVRSYERAGVAAMHLEDQALPKRCGQLGGARLVEPDEHAARIRAAVAARSSADGIVIIGRTDSVGVEGIDAAIDRAKAYGEAGSDVLFVEGLATVEEITRVGEALSDWPLLYPWVDGRSPQITAAELGELGYAIVIYPATAILSVTATLRAVYADLSEHGVPSAHSSIDAASLDDYSEFLGASEAADIEDSMGYSRAQT